MIWQNTTFYGLHKRSCRTNTVCSTGPTNCRSTNVPFRRQLPADSKPASLATLRFVSLSSSLVRRSQLCQASEQAARAKRLAELRQSNVADEDDPEAFDIFESRVSESILLQDAETVRLKHYADEFTVIGLWAMAEQYMGRVYATAFAVRSGMNVKDVVPPPSWTKLKNGFCEHGICVETLHSFSDADECRVLNNKIKHVGRVDAHLAKIFCLRQSA